MEPLLGRLAEKTPLVVDGAVRQDSSELGFPFSTLLPVRSIVQNQSAMTCRL